MKNYRLFVDLDGVLADFDRGVKGVMGLSPGEMSEKLMWSTIARTKDFYNKLPWIEDGKELWDFCKKHSPHILTGLPLGRWAEPQKRAWCLRELGPDVPVITCLSREKGLAATAVLEEGEIPVLVDDRLKAKPGWDAIGGIFIFHTSAQDSLSQLKELGF